MELKEGVLLQGDEFQILNKLGQGGFGITYLAQQKSLNRKVAIKEFFMKDCCQRDEHTTIVTVPTIGNRELVNKYKDKFKREAQFTAGLSHPNIVTIYSIFEENETVYYVMEFLSGGSLADYIKDRALSEAEAVEYVKQISDALKLMHSNKENHLDVKPGNIMMRGNGNVVLIDFGLTKIFDDDGNPMTTTSSVATFTPHYAPIEQYKGIKEFSPETDIYSLGATLYRLVVGKVAPEADEILQDGLPSLPEHLSQNVKDAITKSMQPRRSDRPKSIDEFVKILLNQDIRKNIINSEETTIINNEIRQKKCLLSDEQIMSHTRNRRSFFYRLNYECSKRHILVNVVLTINIIFSLLSAIDMLFINRLFIYGLIVPISFILLLLNDKRGLLTLLIYPIIALIIYRIYLMSSSSYGVRVGMSIIGFFKPIIGLPLLLITLPLKKYGISGYRLLMKKRIR